MKSRKREPHRTQETILACAAKIFAEHGYAGARIDDIAEQSGMNKRMIYHYFGDKRGLYTKVLEEQLLHMSEHLQVPELDSEYEIIKSVVEAYFDYCRLNPNYISLMIWEMVSEWKTLNRIFNQVQSRFLHSLIETIEAGVQKGVFHSNTHPRIFLTLTIVQVFCFFPVLKHPDLLQFGQEHERQDSDFSLYKAKVVDQVMRALKP
jgi:Transcriptional regulator